MIAWQAKDAADIRVYGIDWAPMLADGDVIASVAFIRDAGDAQFTGKTETGTFTYVTISGGTNGIATRFKATLTTANGAVFNEIVWLPIVSSACMEYQPSTVTKRTIVEMAYEDCGLPGYEFSASPEELVSSIRRLDAMMREWPCGQKLGYNFPSELGKSESDDPALVPDWALPAIYGKLAVKIAPGLGKTLSNEQKSAAASAYSILLGRIPVPQIRYPASTPRGAGNKQWAPWMPYVIPATCRA